MAREEKIANMTASFEPAYQIVLDHEGGYLLTHNKADRGGQTFGGISRRANPDWVGWSRIDAGGAMDDPQLIAAHRELFRQKYWAPIGGDNLRSQGVADCLYSCSILSGPSRAVRLAQTVLGLHVDGVAGPKTREALAGITEGETDEPMFMMAFALARIARYVGICTRDQSQKRFLWGWISRALEDAH